MLGADAAGVEKRVQDVQYMRNERIKHSVKEERLKRIGRRRRFAIGKEKDGICVFSSGETVDSDRLIEGFI